MNRESGTPPIKHCRESPTHIAFSYRKAQGSCKRSMNRRLTQRGDAHMNNVAATLAIRTRLRQRTLPYGSLWRRLGEYAGGGLCDGCGEHITSAQASYAVDFTPGVTPESVRFHRVCFEIWQCECQTALPQVYQCRDPASGNAPGEGV